MTDPVLVVLTSGSGLAAVTAIYHAGVLRGRFNKHEELIEKRVDALEEINATKISREEIDARFDGIHREVRDTRELVSQVLREVQRHNGGHP